MSPWYAHQMNVPIAPNLDALESVSLRTEQLFKEQQQSIIRHTDRLCSWLMIFQCLFAIAADFWHFPLSWSGGNSQIHPDIWEYFFLGGLITAFPVYLARGQPG